MYEILTAIEVEDEEGNTQILKVKRLITQEPLNADAVFSNELIFRAGGGAIARRVDNRAMTLADDAIADAHRRQQEETERLRAASMSSARTGGEQGIAADQHRQEAAEAPARRPRRGSRTEGGAEQPAAEQQPA